jgi:hypothetical protein
MANPRSGHDNLPPYTFEDQNAANQLLSLGMRPQDEMIETPYGEVAPTQPVRVIRSPLVLLNTDPLATPYQYPHFSSSRRLATPLDWSQDKERSFYHMTGDMERILPFTPERISLIQPIIREFLFSNTYRLARAYDNTLATFFNDGPDVVPRDRVQLAIFKARMAVDRDEGALTDEYNHMISLVFGGDQDSFMRLNSQGALPRIRVAIENEEFAKREAQRHIDENFSPARRRDLNNQLAAHLREYDLQRDRELQSSRWPQTFF